MNSNCLDEMVKIIGNPEHSEKKTLLVAAIDYPFGSSSTDVRVYGIHSAKERGAQEVEVMVPYALVLSNDTKALSDDMLNVLAAAQKADIALRYVVDINSPHIDEAARNKLIRLMGANKVQTVSISLGFFDTKVNHSETVLKMRNIKNKSGCLIKAFVRTNSSTDFALYPRAGADMMGVDWKIAPFLAHAYEDMVQKKS